MQEKSKRTKYFFVFGGILLTIALVVALLWLFVWRGEESTDNAYVRGNSVQLNAHISGIVTEINAENTDCVSRSEVLAQLDRTDYQIAYNRAKAALAESVRRVGHMFQSLDTLEAALEESRIALAKARIDYDNRAPLVESGAISKEAFEHSTLALDNAQAHYERAYHAYLGQKALVENTHIATHPLVEKAKSDFRQAYVNLERTQVRSPVDGYVAQRSVQLGESISQQAPLMAIVPLFDIWVDANFKETQLASMRIGQKASVYSDVYGRSVEYRGTVVGLSPGTGASFALLPPQNATGNWIKIVQRVPVRIELEKEAVRKYPLALGMSMHVSVDTSDTSGERLSTRPVSTPVYTTDVYKGVQQGAEPIIEHIIRENMDRYEIRRG